MKKRCFAIVRRRRFRPQGRGDFVEAASSRFSQGTVILHAEAAGCRFYGACACGTSWGEVDFGNVTRICYNAFNAPVTVTDANGIVTECSYSDAGCVTRIVRRDGSDVLSSLDVACDACGHLVREGDRTYTYGYLDKVMSVRDGANTYTYAYHPDGQLARANYGRARSPSAPQGEDSSSFETFAWDGLALIQRGDEQFINEPHIGGGNPVVSSKGTSYFNDMLGTTVGAKSGATYTAAALSAFGEDLNHHSPTPTSNSHSFYTGKPEVAGLGHAFLMRNYRAGLAKWQTADPMGYPDGWNQLAYCGNGVTGSVDLWGCVNLNLFAPGTMQWTVANFYDESGYFTVGAHGREIHDASGSILTASELASQIRAKGWSGSEPIKLLSCETAVGASSTCQELANELRVSVFAADTLVWYIPTDRVWYYYVWPFADVNDPSLVRGGVVEPYRKDSSGQPDFSNPGRFIEFRPE